MSSGSSFLPLLLIPAAMLLNYFVSLGLTSRYDYECPNCGKRSQLSPGAMTFAPHSMGRKRMRCPQCGQVGWLSPVAKGS